MAPAGDGAIRETNSLNLADGSAPSHDQYLGLIKYMRGQYNGYDVNGCDRCKKNDSCTVSACFLRVDVVLDEEKSIQFYLTKRDLYLRGWTIDDPPLGGNGTTYVAASKDNDSKDLATVPSGLGRIVEADRIPIEHGRFTQQAKDPAEPFRSVNRWIIGSQLEEGLHRYSKELLAYRADPRKNKKPGSAKVDEACKAFDAVAYVTAEMARFEPYCMSFSLAWNAGGWDGFPRSGGSAAGASGGDVRHDLPHFCAAVNEWSKLSQLIRDGKGTVDIGGGKSLSVQNAKDMIGGGVLCRPGITTPDASSSGGKQGKRQVRR
ncbi:hypothetical protein GCM10009677_54440 [Sphaerisporangium rubeum]|uniref:Uncharacterized protein n=1 Tax=Sphaerisporangium rubeum TaxID=321317 RepID=A0A7X0M5I3_9ACTN|nr:hypothetical protein [Sphaerisporangium rubeum]MBB6470989.1 hypothetical protein [Sphaerisporangium rubeum]